MGKRHFQHKQATLCHGSTKYIAQGRGQKANNTQQNDETTQQTESHKQSVEIISLLCKGIIRGVFLANHLASIDNLTSNNQKTEHIQVQTNITQKVAIINNKIHTPKTYANIKDGRNLAQLLFMTSGQEIDWVYSFNRSVYNRAPGQEGKISPTLAVHHVTNFTFRTQKRQKNMHSEHYRRSVYSTQWQDVLIILLPMYIFLQSCPKCSLPLPRRLCFHQHQLIRLFVSRNTQKLLNRFSQNSAEMWHEPRK